MKKIWLLIGIFSITVLIVGVNIYHATTKESIEVKTTSIEKREISDIVMIPGTLKLINEQKVFFDPEKGEVKEILIKEGDKVKKGDPIVRYENEQLQLERKQNQLSIELNYIRISQLEKQIKNLEEKKEELIKEIGEKEAAKQVQREKDQLETEMEMANVELKQNLLQKEMIERKINELVVKSNLDGVVISVNREAAQPNTEPAILVHVGDLNHLKVEGVISEYDSLKVKESQHVTLKSDIIPEQEWKGKISKIGILPNQIDSMTQNSTSVQYPIEVLVESQNISAKPGFQLIMEIETDRKKVNTLPLKAIRQDGDHYFVFVVKNGKAIKKEIEIGLTKGQYIEVKEGLAKDDKVVINSPNNLENGMEVTVR